MIASLFTWLATSRRARAALRYGALALAVILFLLSIRRAGERTGRLLERLDAMENTNDVPREMLEARLAALVTAVSLLAGCATGGCEGVGIQACPPVVDYGAKLQAQAAAEMQALPAGSAVAARSGTSLILP